MQTRILRSSDIQQLVQAIGIDRLMDEMIGRLRTAIQQYDPTRSVTPQRTGFNYQHPTGLIEWMPLHQIGDEVLMKVVGYHPECPSLYDSPTIVSTISTYSTATGHLVSLMDGTLATAMRTGAASAIASELLAAPRSSVLGLVGCGAQAVTQLHAIARVFDLERVLIYDTDEANARSFGTRAGSLAREVPIETATLEEIASHSDIVCTATSVEVGCEPVIPLQNAQTHLHVNAVGSDFPGKTELDIEFLRRSLVCPDFLPQATVEGECQRLEAKEIGPCLTEIAQAPSETYKSRLTVFDSTGWALEDWVASCVFLEHAMRLEIGENVAVEYLPADPHNPYDFLQSFRVPTAKQNYSKSETTSLPARVPKAV